MSLPVVFRCPSLFMVALSLILGVIVGEAIFPVIPVSMWIAVLWIILLGTFWAVRKKPVISRLIQWALTESALVLSASFVLGAVVVSLSLERSERFRPDNQWHDYPAVLSTEPVVRGRVLRCELLTFGLADSAPVRLNATFLRDTLLDDDHLLHAGIGIHVHSRIAPLDTMPFRSSVSSHFSYQRYLQVRGVRGQTFITPDNWEEVPVDLSALSMVERSKLRLMHFRRHAVESLHIQSDSVLPSSSMSQSQAVLAAMVLGDKSAISKETRDSYAATGASHILALSGLHLGIIYFLLFSPFIRLRWSWAGMVIVLPVIWMYALMVGFMPSVVRAAIMLTIFGFASLRSGKVFSLNSLSLAAIVMLLVSPLSLWDVGLQLSFMAILGILLFYRTIADALFRLFGTYPSGKEGNGLLQKIMRWIVKIIAVSMSTQLLTAPLVAYYFGKFPTYFLLTNLVAIPIVTIILYVAAFYFLIVAGSILMGFGTSLLQTGIARVLEWLAGVLNCLLNTIALWPSASIKDISINSLQVVLLYVLLALLVVLFHVVRKNYRHNYFYTLR